MPLVDGSLMDAGSHSPPFLGRGQLQPGRLLSLLEGPRPAILAGLNWQGGRLSRNAPLWK